MLRIGGFLEQSLIDWEGKIVSVVFTKGCNFRCIYCHNPSLVIPELMNETEDIKEDTVLSYLTNRKGWLDGVVISGGEPTINKDLPDFLYRIKQIGLEIMLYTNGTNPDMIKSLIDRHLIDSISMDIKTILTYDEYIRVTNHCNHNSTEQISNSVRIIRNSGIQYQFRTTILADYHNDEIIARLKKDFPDDHYILQPFRQGITISSLSRGRYP